MCLLGVTHFQHLDNWSLEHISHLQALPWLFFNQSALVKKKILNPFSECSLQYTSEHFWIFFYCTLYPFSRMIYYLDPSVLSGVSCFVMFLCLADYLVPTLAPRIFGSNTWFVFLLPSYYALITVI